MHDVSYYEGHWIFDNMIIGVLLRIVIKLAT